MKAALYRVPLLLAFIAVYGIGTALDAANPPLTPEQFLQEHETAIHGNPNGIRLNVRFKDGKTRFHMGELMTLEIEFVPERPGDFFYSTRYIGRQLGTPEGIHISPGDHVVDPIKDTFVNFADYTGALVHTSELIDPLRFQLELNDWWRIDAPGKYSLYVTSNRIMMHMPFTNQKEFCPEFASEEYPNNCFQLASVMLHFEVLPSDPEWEAATLEKAQKSLPVSYSPSFDELIYQSPPVSRRENLACKQITALGTVTAARVMARKRHEREPRCSNEFYFGLFSSPHRAVVIQEMERLFDSPDHVIDANFVKTLAMLAHTHNNPKWQNSWVFHDESHETIEGEYWRRYLEHEKKYPYKKNEPVAPH